MNTIAEVKKKVQHREWAEQVRECQNSGLAIKEWGRQNGGNVYTYCQSNKPACKCSVIVI